jgi:probable F420-dependent oxidoreductase
MNDDTERLRFGVSVDFRNPAKWKRPFDDLFIETVKAMSWVEELGFDYICLGEHHFSDDGYAPSPLVTANAIAQHTTSIKISTAVLLLPLYHPVRLAEDCALIDILSGGRFELGVAVGWRPEEFAAFGIPLADRGRRANESLEIIRRLWQGESLTFEGQYFQVNDVRLMPLPIQKPRPPIWVGGYNRAAIRRAATLADGMVASNITEETYQCYLEELQIAGKDPSSAKVVSGFRWFMVSNEPAATFDEVAPYIVDWVNCYADWLHGENDIIHRVADGADLRKFGLLEVVHPDEAVEKIQDYLKRIPCYCLNLKLCPPGYPLPKAREHLELFASSVMARLR